MEKHDSYLQRPKKVIFTLVLISIIIFTAKKTIVNWYLAKEKSYANVWPDIAPKGTEKDTDSKISLQNCR